MEKSTKDYEVSVNLSFDVSFAVSASSEAQAKVKVENLMEIMASEGTVDCHIHKDYDVYVDRVEVKRKNITPCKN